MWEGWRGGGGGGSSWCDGTLRAHLPVPPGQKGGGRQADALVPGPRAGRTCRDARDAHVHEVAVAEKVAQRVRRELGDRQVRSDQRRADRTEREQGGRD